MKKQFTQVIKKRLSQVFREISVQSKFSYLHIRHAHRMLPHDVPRNDAHLMHTGRSRNPLTRLCSTPSSPPSTPYSPNPCPSYGSTLLPHSWKLSTTIYHTSSSVITLQVNIYTTVYISVLVAILSIKKYFKFRSNKLLHAYGMMSEIYYWLVYPNILELTINSLVDATEITSLPKKIAVIICLIISGIITIAHILIISYYVQYDYFTTSNAFSKYQH
jgi:hypothetical protein